MITDTKPAAPVYQVSQLVTEIRQMLEASYRACWVEAEISSLSRPASGHLYFSLKDDSAQIRCAMFKAAVSSSFRNSAYRPKEGDLVRVRGRVSVYTQRGDMQFIVQHMEAAGEGLLKKQFDELKQRLSQEGLFNQEHKQILPTLPQRIGVITSPSGAAISDILTTLQRRFPSIPVSVYPSLVQGDAAPQQLTTALRMAELDKRCDVLIITRGGGSMEDLWGFNDETLARAIHACPIPIVSAVGHEVDVSICDFVADVRAATPTAAAELVTPDQQHYVNQLAGWQQRLLNTQRKNLQDKAQQTDWLAARLVHPRLSLREKGERLREINLRLQTLQTRQLTQQRQTVTYLQQRLNQHTPQQKIANNQSLLDNLQRSLQAAMSRTIQNKNQQFNQIKNHLQAVSPLSVLERGYSIAASSAEFEQVVINAKDLNVNENIYLKFSKGSATCRVIEVQQND